MPTSILNPVEPERTPLQDGEGPDTLRNDTIVTLTPHLPEIPGYEVIQELGRGGMGIVFKARDVRLKRLVAIKMLLDPEFASPEQRMRFRIEAEAVAQLRHPHIVQVYELGEMPGVRGGIPHPYMVLEYVEGPTLFRYQREHHFTELEAAQLMITLARAIQHAHDHGLIHRDLKPSNILMSHECAAPSSDTLPPGRMVATGTLNPKITDFGLVKAITFEDEARRDLTAPELLVGTPQYMAPELASPDHRAPHCSIDIYSLGVIFYELLTEHLPFETGDVLQMLVEAQTLEPPSPRKFKPQLNRDLETICLKCLEKDPQRRYLSAAALADDLTRFLHHEPIHARPLTEWQRFRKWMRRHPTIAALAGLLFTVVTVALIAIASFWYQAEQDRYLAESHSQQAELSRDLARISEQTAREAASKAQAAEQTARESEQRAKLSLYYNTVAQADLLIRQGQVQRAENLLDNSWTASDGQDPRSWEYYYLKRLCRPMEQILRNAQDYIQRTQFLPDRQGLLVCEGAEYFGDYKPEELPGKVYLFSRRTGQKTWQCRTIYTDPVPLRYMSLACNGRYAIVMDFKNDLKVLDLENLMQQHSRVTSHELPAGMMHKFALDAGLVLLWKHELQQFSQVDVYDIRQHKVSGQITLPEPCRLIEISANGRHVLFVTQNNETGVIDVEKKQLLWKKAFPLKDWRLGISSDGSQLAVGCHASGEFYWLQAENGAMILHSHVKKPLHIEFTPDNQQLLINATSQHGQEVLVWSRQNPDAMPLVLRGHEGDVTSQAYDAACQQMVTTGTDGTVRVWNIQHGTARAGECLQVYRGHKGTVRSATFDPHSSLLASGGIDANIILWNLQQNLYRDKYQIDAGSGGEWISDYRFIEGTPLLAIFEHRNRQLVHLNLETRNIVKKMVLPGVMGEFRAPRQDVRFTPDGRKLACVDVTGHHVLLFDVMNGQLLWKSPAMPFYAFRLSISGDGSRILIAGHFIQADSNPPRPVPFRCEYQVWSLDSPALIHREELPMFSTAFTLNQDGTQVGAIVRDASRKQYLKLIDLADQGKHVYTKDFDLERCVCLCFSPDGKWLAGCNFVPEKNILTLRDARTGEEKHRLFAGYEATELAFSPDSQRVLVAGYDSNMVVFDTTLGQEIFTLKHHGSPRQNDYALNPRIVFNKAGTRLAIHSWDAALSVWHAYKPQNAAGSK